MESSELSNLDDEITEQLLRVRKHAPFDNAESYIIFLETLLRSMHKNQIESKKTDQERIEEHQHLKKEIKGLAKLKKTFRGKKVSKENKLLYDGIDEALEAEQLERPNKRRKKSRIISDLCQRDPRFKEYLNNSVQLRRNYDRYKK